MFVQIVSFRRKDITHDRLMEIFDKLAPGYAALPGLLSKIWLEDAAAGNYGGVYVWENEAAAKAFTETELYSGLVSFPNLEDLQVKSYGVVEGPTKLTRGFAGAHA